MALADARCAEVSYEDAAEALQELRERLDAPRAALLPDVAAAAKAVVAAGVTALRGDASRSGASAAGGASAAAEQVPRAQLVTCRPTCGAIQEASSFVRRS